MSDARTRGPALRMRPGEIDGRPLGTAVVIDVLRATSTATVLASRAPREMLIVEGREHVERILARGGERPLIFSEHTELADLGDWHDNSPALARTASVEGRLVVLVTTNGTRTVGRAAPHAHTVLLASFLNLNAVARALSAAPAPITVLPSGDFDAGTPHTEDDACAEALLSLYAGDTPDLDALFSRCRADPRMARRIAKDARFEDDLDLALSTGYSEVVPEVIRAADNLFRVVGGAL